MNASIVNRAVFCLVVAATVAAAQSSFGALLLNYQFESVVGTAPTQTTPDSSGNFVSSNPTPLVNAVLGFGTNTPGTDYPQLVAGPVQSVNPASAMKFYGGAGTSFTRVEIADASAAALDAAFTNFSFAAWVNPSSLTNDRFIAGKIGGSGQRGWQFYSPNGTTNLTLDYFASSANSTDRTFSLANVLPLDTWTHVAFAFDGGLGTEALYINGVAQSLTNTGTLVSPPATLNGSNSAAFRVGHRGATGTSVGAWNGALDDVRIYNETLSQSQVQALIVPEPSGVTLLILGVVGLVLGGRRLRSRFTCSPRE